MKQENQHLDTIAELRKAREFVERMEASHRDELKNGTQPEHKARAHGLTL